MKTPHEYRFRIAGPTFLTLILLISGCASTPDGGNNDVSQVEQQIDEILERYDQVQILMNDYHRTEVQFIQKHFADIEPATGLHDALKKAESLKILVIRQLPEPVKRIENITHWKLLNNADPEVNNRWIDATTITREEIAAGGGYTNRSVEALRAAQTSFSTEHLEENYETMLKLFEETLTLQRANPTELQHVLVANIKTNVTKYLTTNPFPGVKNSSKKALWDNVVKPYTEIKQFDLPTFTKFLADYEKTRNDHWNVNPTGPAEPFTEADLHPKPNDETDK